MSSSEKTDLIVFAPHPDDEALGCAGLIYNELKKERDVKVVMLTNGDADTDSCKVKNDGEPDQSGMIELGYTRQKETISAMKVLGLTKKNIIFLGYPDHCLHDFLLTDEFNQDNPYQSKYTGFSRTEYDNSYSQNVPYCRESFVSDIQDIIKAYHPKRIYITHPKDIHGDHKYSGKVIRDVVKEMNRFSSIFGFYISHVSKIHNLNMKQRLYYKGTRNLRESVLTPEVREIKEKCLKKYKTQKQLLLPISRYFIDREYFWKLV